MKLEFFLARKYLASHRGRGLSVITWIAIAGVVVGVMSLVCVLSVMSGFDRDLREKILGNNAHIFLQYQYGVPVSTEDWDDEIKRIENMPSVLSAMPVVYGEAFLLSPSGGSQGAFVKAVPPDKMKLVSELDQYLVGKKWEDFRGASVFLGETLAYQLGVVPGDFITLLLNRPEITPLGVTPRMKKLIVVDVFQSGLTQADAQNIFVPIDFGRELFRKEPQQIEIRAVDVRKIEMAKKELKDYFSDRAEVRDWISANKDFLAALQLEKLVMGLILGMIILVAAFNICGSLIMVVRDKTKDIAILKSMGTPDSRILRIFFMQGIFIGALGTIIGVILGVIASLLLRDWVQFPLNPSVYMINRVPVDLRVVDVITVIFGAFVITSLATIYPALLASRLKPTEGLKSE
jgi:lipoprotein-releasing system permease protein